MFLNYQFKMCLFFSFNLPKHLEVLIKSISGLIIINESSNFKQILYLRTLFFQKVIIIRDRGCILYYFGVLMIYLVG